MRVRENPAAAEEKIRRAAEYLKELHPRDEGLHVSDLIGCRRKAWYKRNGYAEPEFDADTQLMFLLGQGHHAILQQDRDEVTHRVEFAGHTVVGNVDDHWECSEGECPEEYKTTRGSSKKGVSQHYVEQGATYCLMEGKSQLRVTVFYQLGDWTGAKKPKGISYDIEFAPHELTRWKREIERRVRVVMADEPPGFNEKPAWACDYCPFNKKFGGICAAEKGAQQEFFTPDDELRRLLEDED